MDVGSDSRNGGAGSGNGTGGAIGSFMGLAFFLEGLMRILHVINGECLEIEDAGLGEAVAVVEKLREPCIARDFIEAKGGCINFVSSSGVLYMTIGGKFGAVGVER